MGGIVVDGGNFDWGQGDRFPMMNSPHFGFQGVNLWEEFGPAAFINRVRTEGMYNIGPALSPMNAFHLLQGLETLSLRMEKHIKNTEKLLDYLCNHPQIDWIKHPHIARSSRLWSRTTAFAQGRGVDYRVRAERWAQCRASVYRICATGQPFGQCW